MTTPTADCQAGREALRLMREFATGAITTDEAATLHERLDEHIAGAAPFIDDTERRLDALEAKPAPIDWKADLYTRLTSRPLYTMFVIPTALTLAAVLAGEISWMQALALIAGTGGGFGVVERVKDTVVAAKKPATVSPTLGTPPQG
jgi:hypothetical protein